MLVRRVPQTGDSTGVFSPSTDNPMGPSHESVFGAATPVRRILRSGAKGSLSTAVALENSALRRLSNAEITKSSVRRLSPGEPGSALKPFTTE